MATRERKECSFCSAKHLGISDKTLGTKGGLRGECFLGTAGTLTLVGQAEVCKTPRSKADPPGRAGAWGEGFAGED